MDKIDKPSGFLELPVIYATRLDGWFVVKNPSVCHPLSQPMSSEHMFEAQIETYKMI
jgi:hypothetical protein